MTSSPEKKKSLTCGHKNTPYFNTIPTSLWASLKHMEAGKIVFESMKELLNHGPSQREKAYLALKFKSFLVICLVITT